MPTHHPRRPTQAALSLAAVVTVSAAWAVSHRAGASPSSGAAAETAALQTTSSPISSNADRASDRASDNASDNASDSGFDGGSDGDAAQVLTELPGLGPTTSGEIPASTDQVVLAAGASKTSAASTVQLFERVPGGWRAAGPAWPAHNALHGWTEHHHSGDLHSPIGVFTLTGAGGLLPDPGSRLPYTRSEQFAIGGTGFEDEPLAGSFDYVIAIDYNRRPGTSPLDSSAPLGEDAGTGIWLHVDHGGPTHGCVSLDRDDLKDLLQQLDPDQHPVVVMGDQASLAR